MFSIEYGVYCNISVYQTVMLSSLYIHLIYIQFLDDVMTNNNYVLLKKTV